MKKFFLCLILTYFVKNVVGYSQLCGNKTRSCTTQILGHDYTEDTCKMEFFPANSPACKNLKFAPIAPNAHIGGVSLKPYILPFDHVFHGLWYSVNHTVLNITFTNIKWKTMKFRFQYSNSKHKNVENHCRNIVISNNVTINDQSVFYYDCYWPIADGSPNGQSHILDFEATDDVIVNRGQYYFNIPTAEMLSPAATIDDWRPFIYIEILTDKMKLHVVPPPSHLKVTAYQIAVMRECDKETICILDETVANTTMQLKNHSQEVTYETSMLRKSGSYYYVVTIVHDECKADTGICHYVESPKIRISNEVQTLNICIASITALIVATLFAYYIALRVMRRYCCKDYILAPGKEIPAPPKVLVVYSSASHAHAKCVNSFVNCLRSDYGFEVLYDGDISTTSHGNPLTWADEAFRLASHVLYIVGPPEETYVYNNIYDRPIITAHKDIDRYLLTMISASRFSNCRKNVVNIVFEHSKNEIPVETRYDKVFFLLKDWQKLIAYLSRNLLPSEQIMRTEKGKCFIEDLKRAKKFLNANHNAV